MQTSGKDRWDDACESGQQVWRAVESDTSRQSVDGELLVSMREIPIAEEVEDNLLGLVPCPAALPPDGLSNLPHAKLLECTSSGSGGRGTTRAVTGTTASGSREAKAVAGFIGAEEQQGDEVYWSTAWLGDTPSPGDKHEVPSQLETGQARAI